jgi:class 3 adenylate cyclase
MVGRELERGRIEQVLDHARRGPAGMVLEGPPGIGKTAVWREAVQLAFDRGYQVLLTAPAEPDALLTFAGLGDLFDAAVNDVMAGLPDPQRRAFTAALLLEEASETPTDSRALPRAVLTAIRRLAASGPLVVAIDDEQWLDGASARVLAFALCRLRDEPVCVLLARRTGSDSGLWPELAKGFGAAGLETLDIAPLDLRTTDLMLRAQLKRTIPRPVLRRIHAASGGDPLYALTIARELPADRAPVAEIGIPRTLADAMRQHLGRLDPDVRDPLLVVAASSTPTLALLQTVRPELALSHLDRAVRAGVIEVTGERVRFTHPLLASTLYSNASPSRRRELHRTLAAALDDEEERARHMALGAEAPDADVALTLERVAEGAARRGAPEAAADLFGQAARLTPVEQIETRSSRWISAAAMHRVCGNLAHARQLLEELLPELREGPTRGRALLELSMSTRADDFAPVEILDEALAEADGDDRLCALIEVQYAVRMNDLGRFRDDVSHARSALLHAKRTGDNGLVAWVSAAQAGPAWFCGLEVDFKALDDAIAVEDSLDVTTAELPSFAKAQVVFFADQVDRARPEIDSLWQRAERRSEELEGAFILFHLVFLEWFAGNHHEARRLFALCEEARDQGDFMIDLFLAWGEAAFALGRGQLTEARSKAKQLIDAAVNKAFVLIGIVGSQLYAQADLWDGLSAEVHERLSVLRESLVDNGFGFMGSLGLGLWTLDAEALIALDRLDDAEAVLNDYANRARRSENPHARAIARRCRGLLLAARSEVSEAIDEMDAALADHARRPLAPEVARTLVEKGALERRAKRKRAAKQTLEQAAAMLEPLDAAVLKDRARDELSRIGLRRATVEDGLTPAQTRVAELVVAGKSNREIANTLYMSQRSVESHLTKIYREFGVRSRAQLLAALAKTATDSPIKPERTNGDRSADTSARRGSHPGHEDGRSPQRVRRAFMFTDIVDSTPLVSVLGDDAWTHLLQWHDRTLRNLFGSHLGEEVDHAGDGFFVAFERADAAVRCAAEIQQRLDRHRQQNGFAPKVRIGVHLDEANYLAGDYHGHGVHLAARIAAQAQGGEVLVSRETLKAVRPAVKVGKPRTAQLKGVSQNVELVPVIWA